MQAYGSGQWCNTITAVIVRYFIFILEIKNGQKKNYLVFLIYQKKYPVVGTRTVATIENEINQTIFRNS